MQGNIFKLKNDKVDEWKEWAQYLKSREVEVIETLREEHIFMEGSFLFSLNSEMYVCLFAYPEKGKLVSGANLDKEINVAHRKKMKECFAERIGSIEDLYVFITP